MHILLTGGTGFIGSALLTQLLAEGHQVTLITRKQQFVAQQGVKICHHFAEITSLDEFDAVINLAGEPIFAKRWTSSQKRILMQSRLAITQHLARLFQESQNPPHTFISASATGFYGDLAQSAQPYDENTPMGNGFTATLCQAWEAVALSVKERTRVCVIRTGIVLSAKGGALAQMLPLYKFSLAGKLGSGLQHWAWISLTDHIQAVLFLLKNANCHGAYNLVAPYTITNADFTTQLAHYLQRCAPFPAPRWALNLILGERAALLLDNQPLSPQRLLAQGFRFSLEKLDFALLFDLN